MTKKDIIDTMAKDAGISKAAAEKAYNSFFASVTKTIKKEKKLTFVGFGTFSVSKRKARKGRNPQTGETIKIKASKTVRFKPGATLKNSI